MGIHKVDDIIIYTNSALFDGVCHGENIEKEIAEWIVDHYEYNIILDILNKNYEGLTEEDKKEIIYSVINSLEFDRDTREKKIENCLKNYLKTENEINLQGFVRFRLREYRSELERVIDDTVGEYIVEREYFAFIDLLKEFVSYQPAIFKAMEVYVSENDVVYKNEKGEDVKDYIEENVFFDGDLTNEDKLLTTLVTIAPEKVSIRFHKEYENEEIKRTIKLIFGERVKFL